MPDGLSHVLTGYILLKNRVKESNLILILTGSILPDMVLRGGRLFFIGHPDKDFFELFLVPLHTPITSIFVCIALSFLFSSKIRYKIFVYLWIGCIAHFIFDFFQMSIVGNGFTVIKYGGYHWFYPISWFDIQFGLFWAENTLLLLIFLLPISFLIFVKNYFKSK